jgi:prepilin-type N-terminal cleavage/methylation domain-containing protein
MFTRLNGIGRVQRGFTLVELVVALAVSSIIALGTSAGIIHLLTQGARNTDYTTVSRHTLNALHWISRDAYMTQTVSPGGSSGFPLTLSWTQWDNTQHEVVYSIDGQTLRRSYTIDGGQPTQTFIAGYIDSTGQNSVCTYSDGVLTVKITATINSDAHAISITKEREVKPRPNL